MQSNIGQNQLRARESGTTVTGIKSTELKQISIYLPPLEVQKKIARVLGALDDKIELNNKINQNLEAQAQALFKSWFVDFEHFGGKMPDDWKIKTIGDVCASISETYNRKDENVVLINTSDVLNGEILTHSLVKNENLKGQFKKTFQKNDILYSEIRPINKRFAFVDIENTYNYIASTKLMVIRPDTSKISPLILYRILKSQDLIDELQHLGVPLIALYHGARQSEIAQLQLDDIIKKDGYYCFNITDEGTEKSIKNKASRRTIPIHPTLIELGLVDFVKEIRKKKNKPNNRIFYTLTPDSRGKLNDKISSWFNITYLKKLGLKTKSKNFHSFRHTFRSEAGRQIKNDNVIIRIGGWELPGMAKVYQHIGIPEMYNELKKLKYPINIQDLMPDPKRGIF